jgi:hypothetical protein
MANKRRTRHRGADDPIGDLREWQNHQYDPGYRSNLGRLRLFSGGRRTKARALLTGFGGLIALLLLFIVLTQAGMPYTAASALIGLAMIALLGLTLARLNPAEHRHSTRRASRHR